MEATPWWELLKTLPPVRWACAYGSAAVRQTGYDATHSMLDLLLVVDDAVDWHGRNRLQNPSHYSAPAWLDGWLQEWGASIYYLPNVTLPKGDKHYKYGVIGRRAFLADLLEWRTLYVAGRLHKPILSLGNDTNAGDDTLQLAQESNLSQAANVASLLSPPKPSIEQFLTTIVSLSYLGDFRMSVAEDPRKIARIVQGQGEQLWSMYRGRLGEGSTRLTGDRLEFDDAPLSVLNRLSTLPWTLLHEFRRRGCLFEAAKRYRTEEAPIRHQLRHSIVAISRLPALTQAVKGIVTAGPARSWSYALAKLSRRLSR